MPCLRLKTSIKLIAILWICSSIPQTTTKIENRTSILDTCNFQFEGKNRDFVKLVCSSSKRSMGVLRQGAEKNVAIKLRIPASVIYKLAKQLQDSEPTEPPPPPPVEQLKLSLHDNLIPIQRPELNYYPRLIIYKPDKQWLLSHAKSPDSISKLKLRDTQKLGQPTHFTLKLKDDGAMKLKVKSPPKRRGPHHYNKNVRIQRKPNTRAKMKLNNKPQEYSLVLQVL